MALRFSTMNLDIYFLRKISVFLTQICFNVLNFNLFKFEWNLAFDWILK